MDQIRAIGTAVRRARREAGLTQAQHAELAETSERTIRDIEKGTGSPSLAAVVRAATVVGLVIEARP